MSTNHSPTPAPRPQRTPDRLTQQDLLRIEERFRLLMECVRDHAIFVMDPEGRVVDWNAGAEHLLGYQEDIIGQPFSVFFTPDEARGGVPEQELNAAVATGRASDDRWHVRKDGTHFFASGVTTALRDEDGSLRGFAKVVRDNTERKRLEEELRGRAEALAEADRKKDEFLAMLAHELRNPLAPILHALHVLAHGQAERPGQQRARDVIERQVRQLTRPGGDDSCSDCLSVSSSPAARSTRQAAGIARHYRPRRTNRPAPRRRAAPRTDGHAAPGTRLAGGGRRPAGAGLRSPTLLNNAAKYTEAGGKIERAARREGADAVIRVRDSGQGITPDMLPHIFDLFTQEQRLAGPFFEGGSLGVHRPDACSPPAGGTYTDWNSVEAASAGLGEGSEFTVRLPALARLALVPGDAAAGTGGPAAAPPTGAGGGKGQLRLPPRC